MDWIESNGGPFICLEKRLLAAWGGIDRLTMPAAEAEHDYDRACAAGYMMYADIIPVQGGEALILADGPWSTTIFLSTPKRILIARAICGSGEEDRILMDHRDFQFDNFSEVLDVNWQSTPIVIFDSSYPGDDRGLEMLSFEIEPGRYRVF